MVTHIILLYKDTIYNWKRMLKDVKGGWCNKVS